MVDTLKTDRKLKGDMMLEFLQKEIKDLSGDEVLEGTKLNDTLLDDMDLVALTMIIEEKYNVTVTDKEALSWKTVGDIVKTIKEKKCLKV